MRLSIDQIDGDTYVRLVCPQEKLCQEIGEPSLKRNRVFRLTNNKILKVYGEHSRWLREVSSLRFLQDKAVSCPFLYETGKDLDFDWAVMSAVPGIVMAEKMDVDGINKQASLYELGVYHARYHQACSVNYCGDWNSIKIDTSYGAFIKGFHSAFIQTIQKEQTHDSNDSKLFKKCVSLITTFDSRFDYQGNFTLCHNDFHPRNILVDPTTSRIEGVIDFERSFFAEPLFDMTRVLLLDTLESIIASAYLRGYEDYVGYRIDKNRLVYYLLLKCIHVRSWSYEIAQDYYFKSKKLLENIVNEYCEESCK